MFSEVVLRSCNERQVFNEVLKKRIGCKKLLAFGRRASESGAIEFWLTSPQESIDWQRSSLTLLRRNLGC